MVLSIASILSYIHAVLQQSFALQISGCIVDFKKKRQEDIYRLWAGFIMQLQNDRSPKCAIVSVIVLRIVKSVKI